METNIAKEIYYKKDSYNRVCVKIKCIDDRVTSFTNNISTIKDILNKTNEFVKIIQNFDKSVKNHEARFLSAEWSESDGFVFKVSYDSTEEKLYWYKDNEEDAKKYRLLIFDKNQNENIIEPVAITLNWLYNLVS